MTTEPDLDIGKIVNHTHRLDIAEIRQIVTERILAQLGEGVVERVEPVHVAPASDSKLLTKAARRWRSADGEEFEFQDTVSGKLFWFGAKYTLRQPDEEGPGEEVPSQWPPEGSQAPAEEGPDPRIAEQLGLDEDEAHPDNA